jgi:hypothetical protein
VTGEVVVEPDTPTGQVWMEDGIPAAAQRRSEPLERPDDPTSTEAAEIAPAASEPRRTTVSETAPAAEVADVVPLTKRVKTPNPWRGTDPYGTSLWP